MSKDPAPDSTTTTIAGCEINAGDPVRVTGVGRGPNDSSFEWVFRRVMPDGTIEVFGGRTNAGDRSRLPFTKYFDADRVLPASPRQLKKIAAAREDARRRAEAKENPDA